MPPKADKLQQNIDSLKIFLQRKSEIYAQFPDLNPKIKKIEKVLAEKKLTLQIVSNQEIFCQAVFDLINKNSDLASAYNIKYDAIPSLPVQPENEVITTLDLVRLIGNSTEIIKQYKLTDNQVYLVGRCPDNNIYLDDKIYRGISWQQAKFKAVIDEKGEQQWQITDLESSNGTFINGKKITNSYILQSGDEITLADSTLKPNIASLKFQQQTISLSSEVDNNYEDVIDCDLLIFIIENIDNITEQEKTFLTHLDTSMMSKQFLVIEIKEEDNIDDKISVTENLIDSLNLNYKLDIFPVCLQPYYEEEVEELSKNMQKRLDKFTKAVFNLVKRQPENILAKRLSVKLYPLVSPLADILIEEDEELKLKIRELQEKLTVITAQNWKDITKTALGNVKEDKDKFFKQIKSDLAQAKAAILDNFSKRSIISQIQNFVEELQPTIFKKEGQPHVKLISPDSDMNSDVNEIAIDFSTSTIENWAMKEWDKIIYTYHHGGLNNLLNIAYQHLQVIPNLIDKSPFLPPEELDIQGNFMISFMGIDSEVRHKQVSMAAYIMKTIRANMMQIMMMATMVFALLGMRMGKNEMFGQLSNVFKQFPFLLGLAVFSLIFFLTNAYNQDNNLKLEEAAEKLKKEVSSYYQSFSKNLVEKVIQDINLALEYEANRIDSSLERVQEIYNDYIMEMEKQQIQVKAKLDSLKEKQKSLSKEISEFKKLIKS